jgi:hypothetical protein
LPELPMFHDVPSKIRFAKHAALQTGTASLLR